MAGAGNPNWPRDLLARLRRYLPLKGVGTTAFISVFFVGYFHVLRSTAHEAVLMPVTALDDLVGFQPAALYVYVSLWVYVGLPPAIMRDLRELIAYGWWIAALCVAGLACFWFWPTAVPLHPVDTNLYPAYRLIQGLDAAGNACPSLHVATAAFSAVWLDRLLAEIGAGWRMRTINWTWFAAIAWSTMATKQHVALDVLAGILLALAFALPSLRLRAKEIA
ncbi:MAG: phosphatase PAP2 family protein [Rhodocyclales bacterium]|nr:phosphatase PAP2 family protein [Rhodocyclales bacterium]